jgi:probable HAF family extracellular repeat protein
MKRRTPQFSALLATSAVLFATQNSSVVAQLPGFEIESTGTVSPNLPDDSWASDINNQGVVAGTSFYTNNLGFTSFRPVLYSDTGLEPLMTYGSASLMGLNQSGDSVGFKLGRGSRAHIWYSTGGDADLHYGPLQTSIASAVSDSREVVGSYDFLDNNPVDIRRGFYCDPTGNYLTMPTLGGQGSGASDINAFGQIVGLAEDTSDHPRAATWDLGASVQSLGVGGELSSSSGINNRGQIIGTWVDTQDQVHGFFLDQGSILDLPALLPFQNAIPADINQAGFVVGESSNQGTSRHAVIWDRQQNVTDLQTLIPANSGWDLETATGINDLGEISGFGFLQGKKRGYRLTPICLRPRISGAQPAIAGSSASTIYAAGFTPQTTVHYFWGTQNGRFSAFGYHLDIADPRWIGQSNADDHGRSHLETSIPLTLLGRLILTQAVDLSSGRPSILMEQRVL